MINKPWFKTKLYGWGWYPSAWQGWLTLVLYLLLLAKILIIIDLRSHSVSDTLIGMIVPFILLTSLLILVCYGTGEKLRWRWGR